MRNIILALAAILCTVSSIANAQLGGATSITSSWYLSKVSSGYAKSQVGMSRASGVFGSGYGSAAAAGGDVVLSKTGQAVMQSTAGQLVSIPISDSLLLPASRIAKGAAIVARSGIPQLVVGTVLLDALVDYGIYRCNLPSGWCYKDPTSGFNWKAYPSDTTQTFSTALSACVASASYWDRVEPSYKPHTMTGVRQLSSTNFICLGTVPQLSGTWQYSTLAQVQGVPVERDSTESDFEEAYRQKMTQQPLKGKELYDLIASQIANAEHWKNVFGDPNTLNGTFSQVGSVGPSTDPVELSRATQQNADGTTSTSVTTAQTTFSTTTTGSTVGDQSVTVTPTTTTTTTTTNNTTGATTTNTTVINNNTTPQLPDSKTDCDKIPDAIGCSKYGTPADETINKQNKNVTFTPVDIGLSGTAQCPQPVKFNVLGSEYSISYDPFCSVATRLRPLVLLVSAAVAAAIVITGLKT